MQYKIVSLKKHENVYSRRYGSQKARIYVFIDQETVMENFLVNRRAWSPRDLRKLLPEICAKAGLVEPGKIHWSRKAGCSCGCSPGFIVDGVRGVEVFVSIKVVA